jgi:hypothetical protein
MGGIVQAVFGGSSGSQQAAYDPYSPYRGAAASQLSGLMSNPSTVTQNPQFQFAQQQGQQQQQRTSAAQGQVNSGAETMAMTNQGQGLATSTLNNLISQLSVLSGAGQNPANAMAGANGAAQIGLGNVLGLGSALYSSGAMSGIGSIFGGGGTTATGADILGTSGATMGTSAAGSSLMDSLVAAAL